MSQYGFIEREIEGLSRFLAKTIFQKDLASTAIIDENGVLSEEEFFKYILFKMIAEGHINEAENSLFETIKDDPRRERLQTAIQFYDRVNKMDDAALKECKFSRAEIIEGLAAIKKLFVADK